MLYFLLSVTNKSKNVLTIEYFPYFQSACFSSPCQNGGTCLANYEDDTFECLCKKGFIGEYCEKGKLKLF